MTSPPLHLVTGALLTFWRAAGRPVFDAAYAGDGTGDGTNDADPYSPPYWYSILYPLAGGSADPFPDLAAAPREVTVGYQLSTVSNRRDQAQQGARILRDRLLTRADPGWLHDLPLPTGWQVIDRRPDPALPGVDRAGQAPNAVFTVPARYLLTVAPA